VLHNRSIDYLSGMRNSILLRRFCFIELFMIEYFKFKTDH